MDGVCVYFNSANRSMFKCCALWLKNGQKHQAFVHIHSTSNIHLHGNYDTVIQNPLNLSRVPFI